MEEDKKEPLESDLPVESQDSNISESHQNDDNLNIDQPTISLENDFDNKNQPKSDLCQDGHENSEIAEPQINDSNKESQHELPEAQDNHDK